MMIRIIRAALLSGCAAFALQASPVTFESLPLGNPATDGSTEYNASGTHYWNGSDGSGGFIANGVNFPNTFTDWGGGFTSWEGFAYSNTTDTTTEGFTNQYSAYPGSGAQGSSQYAIAFGTPILTYDSPFDFSGGRGLFVTNNTYAALEMANGSPYSKKFGGDSGNDEDWFLLTVSGSLGGGGTGNVGVYLADFRFSDNSQDCILDDWAFVDLSSLGIVDSLTFTLSSSDTGIYGMNTPAYFALDNVGAIPEPGTLSSLLLGGLLLLAGRRWAHSRRLSA